MEETATKQRFPFRLAPYFVTHFACNAIYQNNIANYLRTANLSASAIGYLLTFIPLAGALGQAAFAFIGDRLRYKKSLLILLGLASAACVYLGGRVGGASVLALSAFLCLHSFFHLPTEPVMNAVALETLERTKGAFGPIRSVGTIACAVFSPLVGMLIDDDYSRMIGILTAALLLCAASATLMPKVKGHARRNPRAVTVKKLLGFKPLLLLTGYSASLMIGFSVFYTFFSIRFTSPEVGGSSALLGWSFFLSSAVELPFLFFSDRIFQRAGAGFMLALSGLLLAVRLVILSLVTSPFALLATQMLHGWGLIVIHFAMAKYINLVVPMELKASGQLLFSLAALSVARSLGSLLGGFLASWLPIPQVFLAGGVFAAAATVLFLIILWKVPALRKAGEQPAT